MESESLEVHQYRASVIVIRLAELKVQKEKLITVMETECNNKNRFKLKKINELIKLHENLILKIDEGQEHYMLEN